MSGRRGGYEAPDFTVNDTGKVPEALLQPAVGTTLAMTDRVSLQMELLREMIEQHRPQKREAVGHYPKGEIFEIWCNACKPYIHYLWREGDAVYECDMWKRSRTLGLTEG